MSDTTKLILAIVVVVVVVAVIISLFMNARRRRELENRRFEAGELRARIDEHAPQLQETADRASVTGAIAADARTEAERTAAEAERKAAEARRLEEQAQQKEAEARRLEEHAQKHAEEAAAAQSSLAELERNADLVDPDVRTDDEGYRLDESGQRLPGREPAGAAPAAHAAPAAPVAASAPFLSDDDEPDLADAENPFAPAAGVASDDAPVGTRSGDDITDESRDDVSTDDTTTREDSTSSTPDTATSESSWEGSSATGAAAAAGTGAAAGWAARSDDADETADAAPGEESLTSDGRASSTDTESTGAQANSTERADATEPAGASMPADSDEWAASSEPADSDGRGASHDRTDEPVAAETASEPSADAHEGPVEPQYDDHGLLVRDEAEETVSVPALEDRDEVLSETGTPDDDPGDHRGQPWATTTGTPPPGGEMGTETGAEEGQATEGALGSRMDPSTETEIDAGDDGRAEERPSEEPQQSGPRISSFEEVVDGGFGIGSAAPLADGAQPLGHDVKASRDGNTFLTPGDEGYDDAQPDVWFYNEESARRAGFRRQGE